MASAVQRAFGLPPVPRALRVIAELSDEHFSALESAVGGPEAFTVRHPRPERLADQVGLREVSDALAVLSSLEFLYENLHVDDDPPKSVPSAVEELLKSFGLWTYLGDNAGKGLDRLARLLAKNPSFDREKKRRWLQTGMLDHAFGFASFIDLRPNFTKEPQ